MAEPLVGSAVGGANAGSALLQSFPLTIAAPIGARPRQPLVSLNLFSGATDCGDIIVSGQTRKENTTLFTGVLLLIIGILMILDKMGIIQGSFWAYLVPAALIALGLEFIIKSGRKRR
jgi:hypothetical protein